MNLFRLRDAPGDQWAILKDIIRAELEPLRQGLDSVGRDVSDLRHEMRDKMYTREVIDSKLSARDDTISDLDRRLVEHEQAFKEHLADSQADSDRRWGRVSVIAAIAGTLSGIGGMLLEHFIRVFGS